MTHLSSSALFGPVIRSLRLNAGLTQQQLSELSGVPSSMISTYERCVNVPETETVIRLLRALGQGLVIAPLLAAKTQRQREDVVIAARARLVNGSGHQALFAAIGRLSAAETAIPDAFESPWETIRELRDEIAAGGKEIEALRAAVATAARALKEVELGGVRC